MKTINLILFSLLLFSCTSGTTSTKQAKEEIVEVKLTKLEELLLLPTDTVMDYYDLSNDSISEFPDLSNYTIKSLDLSYNQLDTLIVDYMPKDIVSLNLSHNEFEGLFRLSAYKKNMPWKEEKRLYKESTIRELDFSYNRIQDVFISFPLRRIIVSHNDLIDFYLFYDDSLRYLDISNNHNLSNIVKFDFNEIDTIIRCNIANNEPFERYVWPPPPEPEHIDFLPY